ncbi:MAG: RsmD family RNA methyltransferase [Verrucomicrobiota bacterium]|nr:RsmD family RNA methyltransferase [Verrucomicrobiota bacterium]
MSLRIISGSAKGIRLQVPKGRDVRPTLDRIKESLFNILGIMQGKIIIDLFAGSGNLGLEALSRGAEKVFFLEKEKRFCSYIEKNCEMVSNAIHSSPKNNINKAFTTKVICADALKPTKILNYVKPDIIFADPPYKMFSESKTFPHLIDKDFSEWASDSLLVIESGKKDIVFNKGDILWKPVKIKEFSDTTTIYFLRRK